jgi:hypothetical protein
MTFFREIENNPKIHRETQKTLSIQSNPEPKKKKSNAGSIVIPDFGISEHAIELG